MMLYSYSRVSTDEQQNSVADQRSRLLAYAERIGQPIAREFVDEDVSGLKTKLRDRPDGKQLCDILQPGDTVVLTAVDRCFRSMADAASQVQVWKSLGINVHFLDVDIDINTTEGELMFHILAAAAQYEARMISKRVKNTFAYLKKVGRPYGNTRPFGWLRQGKEYVPCQKERELGDHAVELRKRGVSYPGIALAFAKLNARKPQTTKNARGYYCLKDVYFLVRAALAGYPKLPKESLPAGQIAG
jgi:DNA invertase Pin-like site-specific DNA recombinase